MYYSPHSLRWPTIKEVHGIVATFQVMLVLYGNTLVDPESNPSNIMVEIFILLTIGTPIGFPHGKKLPLAETPAWLNARKNPNATVSTTSMESAC